MFRIDEACTEAARATGVAPPTALGRLLGRSRAMQAMFDEIAALACSDASVLVSGDSGTGKELVARAMHDGSRRKDGPFIAVNCAAIPEALLESELFGHEKGAFTGADRKRRGLFVEAGGGTLLLDEIGDLSPALQAKLLRVLQDKSVRPVGGCDEVRADVRIISATHRDLAALIADGTFREDLYYRLAVLPLRVPSLRERGDDIILLAQHFLRRTAEKLDKPLTGFDDDARTWLLRHRWPGNVRELENVVERAATLARQEQVTRADLRPECAPLAAAAKAWPPLAEMQAHYIRRVLELTKGDKVGAAKILGISVRTLQRRDA